METLFQGIRLLSILAGTATIGLGPALAADHTLIVKEMKFGPAPTEVHVGDVIVWQNDDIFRHSATARDKSFDIDLPVRSSVRMAVTSAGSFDFFCKFHPGMKGTLVVAP